MSVSQYKWLGIVKHRIFPGITFAVTNRPTVSQAGFFLPLTDLIFEWESLHFAMLISPAHVIPSAVCASIQQLGAKWIPSSFRPRRWLGAQTTDSDCDWLREVKRFTAGSFFFWNKTALKQFPHLFETVLKLFCLGFCFSFISFVRTIFRGWGRSRQGVSWLL